MMSLTLGLFTQVSDSGPQALLLIETGHISLMGHELIPQYQDIFS